MGIEENALSFISPTGRTCVIFGAGPFDMPFHRFLPEGAEKPLYVCADGGIENARRAGIAPDIAIGDFDSAQAPQGVEVAFLPAEKDVTDLRACVDHGLKKGCKTFVLLCCTGGRLDHFLANLSLLEYLDSAGTRGVIANSRNLIRFMGIERRLSFDPVEGYKYVSVLAADPVCRGVTLAGMKYPLNNATVTREDAIGVSNEPIGGKITISIDSGRIYVILSR